MDWLQIGQDLLSNIVILLLQALVPVVITALVVFIAKKWQEFKAAKPDAATSLSFMADIFVRAAEQMKLNKFIDNKLDYATSLANTYLKSHGWKLDAETVRAIIEEAVYANFPKKNDSSTDTGA